MPEHHLPAALLQLESLPRGEDGEVAFDELPEAQPVNEQEMQSAVANSDIERELALIWAEVLGLESVGIHDNFFTIGGDSILTTVLIARANLDNLYFTPKQLFEAKTIAELAKMVSTQTLVEAEQGEVLGPVPLLPIQRWFFDKVKTRRDHFNLSVLLQVNQSLQMDALVGSAQALVQHHDALRLRFEYDDSADSWTQQSMPWEAVADIDFVTHVDMLAVSEPERESAFKAEIERQQTLLNISLGPIIRLAWFDYGPDAPGRLQFVVHHLAVDGVSWRVILDDFGQLYEQLTAGEAPKLRAKTTSYKAWTEQIGEYRDSAQMDKEKAYWLDLAEQTVPELPVDLDGENLEASLNTVSVSLDEDTTQALLQQVPAVYNTQINDILLTAMTQALCQNDRRTAPVVWYGRPWPGRPV